MPRFVNREEELGRLRGLYDSDAAELAVIWGRRRIGKTRLVLESLNDRDPWVYYQAEETTAKEQLDRFVRDAAETFPGFDRLERDWETVILELIERDAIVVLDEFPYLAEAVERLPSLLQRLWDHETADSSCTVVLTGSSIGMMQELTLDGGAPLYGRVAQRPSGKFPIEPLAFGDAVEFFGSFTPEEQVFAYGVFGGVPHYLQAVDDGESVHDNIVRTLVETHGPLHEEPTFLLRMEVDEVRRYVAVLRAMASGKRTRNEIAGAAGIDANSSSYYLDRLRDIGMIRPHHPVTADPNRTRKRRYRIRDQLVRFWFRFIYGSGGRYEMDSETAYAELIEPELPDFVSGTFEGLCRRAVPALYDEYTFQERPGSWWDGGREIDVVGLTTGTTLVAGEAKFTNASIGYDVLARLREEAPMIGWTPPGGGAPEVELALFSRGGFKPSVREAAAEDEQLRLFTLDDVVSALVS